MLTFTFFFSSWALICHDKKAIITKLIYFELYTYSLINDNFSGKQVYHNKFVLTSLV